MADTQISDFPDQQFSHDLDDLNYVRGTVIPDRPDRDRVFVNWPDMDTASVMAFTKKGFKLPDDQSIFKILESKGTFIIFQSENSNVGNPRTTVAINVIPGRYTGLKAEPHSSFPGKLNVRFNYAGGNDIACNAILTADEVRALQFKIREKQSEIKAKMPWTDRSRAKQDRDLGS